MSLKTLLSYLWWGASAGQFKFEKLENPYLHNSILHSHTLKTLKTYSRDSIIITYNLIKYNLIKKNHTHTDNVIKKPILSKNESYPYH